ncbi:hypothetical protein CBER1_03052 [Cercospora berteroae]|uniref:Integral membrane protein n=1 Tax=Cercospora berteroae TaxID=357750 RepID=A0A2S6CHH4_9PEZI|nr:hypothetical protein CBER1_03052 [Cercospora berteroae]
MSTFPSSALRHCPTPPNGIDFPAHWHRFTNIPNFWICSKCYEEHIASSPLLITLCEQFHDDPLPGTTSYCDFNTARAKQLLQKTLRSGIAEELLAFAKKRSEMPMCEGETGVRGGKGFKWWGLREVEGLVVCEACFEDWVVATSWAERFYLRDRTEHGVDDLWNCDLAVPVIRRSLLQCAARNAWQDFVGACQRSLAVPACGGQVARRGSRRWFRLARTQRIAKMMVCEMCFLNYAGGLTVAGNFEEVKTLPLEAETECTCTFKLPAFKACSDALLAKKHDLWHEIVSEMIAEPACSKGAIADVDWYVLTDPDDPSVEGQEFDVCVACYAGLFTATGFGYVLRRRRYPVGTERICDFSPIASRSRQYLRQWRRMNVVGDINVFAQCVKRISLLPSCPASSPVKDRRWYGMDEFYFCESCYEEIGRGSYFAAFFTIQDETQAEAYCDMYTDNMRSRYVLACRARDLSEFIPYCERRAQMWKLCRDNLELSAQMQTSAQQHLGSGDVTSPRRDVGTGRSQGDASWSPPSAGAEAIHRHAQGQGRLSMINASNSVDLVIWKQWAEME